MTVRALLMSAAAALFLTAAPAYAQQPAPEGQNPDEVPTLTTDDVAPTQAVAPEENEAPAEEELDPGLTPEERADAARPASPSGEGEEPEGRAKGPSQAELAWRQRYEAAESRSRDARRAAQEAEIAITRLRNRLSSTASAEERNALAEQIEAQGARASSLSRQAEAAEAELGRVAAEGQAQKFRRAPGPAPRRADGSLNPDYVRDRYTKAADELTDAERRVELYQFRVSDLQTRITINSGTGDNYAQSRLQSELDEARRELEKAQADRARAAEAADAARRAAANAGVALPRN